MTIGLTFILSTEIEVPFSEKKIDYTSKRIISDAVCPWVSVAFLLLRRIRQCSTRTCTWVIH